MAALLLCGGAVIAAAGSEVADAVMNGDQAALRALIQKKADVNARRPTARPPSTGPSTATTSTPPRGSSRPVRMSGSPTVKA